MYLANYISFRFSYRTETSTLLTTGFNTPSRPKRMSWTGMSLMMPRQSLRYISSIKNGSMVHHSTRSGNLGHFLCRSYVSTSIYQQSGLTKACLESTHTREYVTSEILKYIKRWIPQPRSGVLAGSSVHADRAFLVEEMPEVIEHLHYRLASVLFFSRRSLILSVCKSQRCWYVRDYYSSRFT